MDPEIEFGDVEQVQPASFRRPDRNKHLAVTAVFAPDDDDLLVFVDLDTMRDIEEHAQTDTGVELGGVMLGGQYRDETGRPFVVVTDSLRAHHYEATKGSFKFTHETWQQISRQRDEFPDELQMVGWYHTHPDWGVFLSGMDMFICENFFNKPLDLALVIDPCRGDRGFFQWNSAPAQGVRRTNGFYLTASRFRQAELAQFAAWLEEPTTMSHDPRFRGTAAATSPVVHVGGPAPAWHSVAVLGMLALQFGLLAVLVWRMLDPNAGRPALAENPAVTTQESFERRLEARRREIEADAKIEMLDAVLAQGEAVPEQLIATLAERTAQLKKREDDLQAHRVFEQDLQQQLSASRSALDAANQHGELLRMQIDELRVQQQALKAANQENLRELSALKKRLEGDPPPEGWSWEWVALATLLGLICAGAIVATMSRPQRAEDAAEQE